MDDNALANAADSVRARARSALSALRADQASRGVEFRAMDRAVMTHYAMESFLRALARSPLAGQFVVKGGNLFKVWDGLGTARPTLDLDVQRIEGANDRERLLSDLRSLVQTEAFAAETGLLFDVGSLKVKAIKKDFLPDAWCVEGDVFLGPRTVRSASGREGRGTTIFFSLEVTHGPAPRGAVALADFPSLFAPKASPVAVLAARPEWMAAEKLHAAASRGMENTRLKDFRDLLRVFARPDVDAALLRDCLEHVFLAEFRGSTPLPTAAADVVGLGAAYAARHDADWRARWPEFEGRAFDPARDPTLAEAQAAVCCALERLGILRAPPAAALAAALARLADAAAALPPGAADAASAAAFAAAFAEVADLAAAGIPDPRGAARRFAGQMALRGRKADALGAYDGAMLAAERAGLLGSLARVWERRRGGPMAAASARVVAVLAAGAGAAPAAPAPAAPAPAAAAPARRPVDAGTSGDVAAAVERMGAAAARRNLAEWVSGFTRACCLVRDGAVPDPALELPEPPLPERAAAIWRGIAAKNGLDPDLGRAMDAVRSAAPAPVASPAP